MNEEKLSIKLHKSTLVSDFYFDRERKHLEYKLATELWDRLEPDTFYTIKIKRETPESFYFRLPIEYGEPVPSEYTTTVYIGKIKPTYMEFKYPKKLSWKERFHVLFTGEIPMLLGEK